LNSGLVFARKVFYHLTHALTPFCFSYFLGRVLSFLPGPASDHNPPTHTSCVAGIKGMCHHTWTKSAVFFHQVLWGYLYKEAAGRYRRKHFLSTPSSPFSSPLPWSCTSLVQGDGGSSTRSATCYLCEPWQVTLILQGCFSYLYNEGGLMRCLLGCMAVNILSK
jgi:hypothetical protein